METSNSSPCIESPYNQLFSHYDKLNSVQTSLLPHLLYTDNSVVLSAPTSSGKTIAFEFAIVRLLQQRQAAEPPPKAIYVAPIKALCSERYHDWIIRFARLGINCKQITGDTEHMDLRLANDVQLVVTTPEKWDSITRRWQESEDFMHCVGLFMIDEVHLLNEEIRGPILEAIVARMKTIIGKKLRFVVASATMPNVSDLAAWIKSGSDTKVIELIYSEKQRPIPLEKHVIGINSKQKGFRFDIALNYKLPEILRKFAAQRATLVFCNSRKSTEMAAFVLEKYTTIFVLSEQQKVCLAQLAERLRDSKLRRLFGCGIAYHHAGMSYEERHLVEDSFRNGHLMLLFCTNTLAMGVNLPAHLVVVKSTQSYNGGTLIEYSESTLVQMIGRAGRPQYDTKGVAVILTQSQNVKKYEQLVNGSLPVESQLHKQLAEHLNSAIALDLIKNLKIAMNWMRLTFFYVRALRNPKQYGLQTENDKDVIELRLEELCLMQINALHAAGLITQQMDSNGDMVMQTTAYGQLMSKYYIGFDTMKLFRQLKGDESFLELLHVIVRCKEFSEFMLRVSEKRDLNALNNSPIRYPIAGRIRNKDDKILCLVQAVFGNYTIMVPALAQEAMKMIRVGERVTKCLLEYMRLYRRGSHDQFSTDGNVCVGVGVGGGVDVGGGCCCYKALLHAVTIAKCFHAKLWENSEFAAKQLRKIGAVYSSLLANAGKKTLKSIAMTDARSIEQILKKSPPFGNEVLEQLLHDYPEYAIEFKRINIEMLQIRVRQVNELYAPHNGSSNLALLLIVGDTANNLLLYNEQIGDMLRMTECFERTFKILDTKATAINAHVISATIVGVDCAATFVLNAPSPAATAINDETSAQTKTKLKRNIGGGVGGVGGAAKKRKATTKANVSSTAHGSGASKRMWQQDGVANQSVANVKALAQFVYKKSKKLSASNSELQQQQDVLAIDASAASMVQTKVTKYYSSVKRYKEREHERDEHLIDEGTLTVRLSVAAAEAAAAATSSSLIGSIEAPSTRDGAGARTATDDAMSTAPTNTVCLIPATQLDYTQASSAHGVAGQAALPAEQRQHAVAAAFDFSKSQRNSATRFDANDFDFDEIGCCAGQQLDVSMSFVDNFSAHTGRSLLLTEDSFNAKTQRPSDGSWCATPNVPDLQQQYQANNCSKCFCRTCEEINGNLENMPPSQNTTACLLPSSIRRNVNEPLPAAAFGNSESKATSNRNSNSSDTSNAQHLMCCYRLALKFSKLQPEARNFRNFQLIHKQMNANRGSSQPTQHKPTVAETLANDFRRRHQLSDAVQQQSNIGNDESVLLGVGGRRHASTYNPYRLQLFADTNTMPAATLTPEEVERLNRDVMKTLLKLKSKQMLCINDKQNQKHQMSLQLNGSKDMRRSRSSSVSRNSSLSVSLLLAATSSIASQSFATFDEYFQHFINSNKR